MRREQRVSEGDGGKRLAKRIKKVNGENKEYWGELGVDESN